MPEFKIGDQVRVTAEHSKLTPSFITRYIDLGYVGTITKKGPNGSWKIDDLRAGNVDGKWLELVSELKTTTQEGKKMSKFKCGDKVKLVGCNAVTSSDVGRTGYIKEIDSGDSYQTYLLYAEDGCERISWASESDLELLNQKAKVKNTLTKVLDPSSDSGKVVRFEVLYTDGTRYTVAGLKNFVYDVKDSFGNVCFQYTKEVNDDVSADFFVKKESIAAIIMKFTNGKTELHEFSEKVVDTVSARLQNVPAKTLLTQEERQDRVLARNERNAKRLEVVKAKGGAELCRFKSLLRESKTK